MVQSMCSFIFQNQVAIPFQFKPAAIRPILMKQDMIMYMEITHLNGGIRRVSPFTKVI